MRILGIDPGSVATGFGVVEQRGGGALAHIAHGVLRPTRGASVAARLAEIHARVLATAREHEPALAVVERILVRPANPRSALVLAQARGAALAALAGAGLSVDEITPQQVKLAVTGGGAADKAQVQRMVQRLLGLARAPAQDAADALAAAIARATQGRLSALPLTPRTRRRPARATQNWVVRRAR